MFRPRIVHLSNCNAYKFGNSNLATPILRDVSWTVHADERWAITGPSKTRLFEMLLGHHRLHPPPPPPEGLFPFLSPRDPHAHISFVSFAPLHQPTYDHSARYGAIWDEDKKTLREHLLERAVEGTHSIEALADKVDMANLLDLPLITLSNGQTRRMRILRALLSNPALLLLDEPLCGLDSASRTKILNMLYALHAAQNPVVILGLREKDPVPDWISHVAVVGDGCVRTGRKEDVVVQPKKAYSAPVPSVVSSRPPPSTDGKILVEMKNVNVVYGDQHVLKDISWTIRASQKWYLVGSNGSGKTTLLSLLSGIHPLSYAQPHLHLFGLRRSQIPTPTLHTRVGMVSPEICAAWRGMRRNRTVRDVIGTGFDGTWFLARDLTEEEERKVNEIVRMFCPLDDCSESFVAHSFERLSSLEQALVLLMRALIGRPPLLLLDEAFAGMEQSVRGKVRDYVGEEQAVVVVSHWEDEVPWGVEDGLRVFKLDSGKGCESGK